MLARTRHLAVEAPAEAPAAMESSRDKHWILVHGLSHGAWCWYKVVARLRAAGHRATARHALGLLTTACAGAQRSRQRGPAGQERGFARGPERSPGRGQHCRRATPTPPGLVGPRPLQRAASSEEAPLLLFIREDVANDDGMEEEEDDVTTRLLPDDV